jgi:hypothetical protein
VCGEAEASIRTGVLGQSVNSSLEQFKYSNPGFKGQYPLWITSGIFHKKSGDQIPAPSDLLTLRCRSRATYKHRSCPQDELALRLRRIATGRPGRDSQDGRLLLLLGNASCQMQR